MGADPGNALETQARVVSSRVLRSDNGATSYDDDSLSIEEPLEIVVRSGGETMPMGVTFRTPGDDESLALGLMYNEGVILKRSDVVSIRLRREEDATMPATRASITVAKHVSLDTERHKRAYPISSACGACGKSALESLRIRRTVPFADGEGIRLTEESLVSMPSQLLGEQADFRRTGGLHAAARFDERCRLIDLAEDIGRHNAMDKLVGRWLNASDSEWSAQALLYSGRLGYDLMQKALVAGCPFVVCIGAPSSFAVELASLFNVTLVGFLRGKRFNVYSAPGRIHFSK